MIKDFEPRLYQQTILATAAVKNTLVVLPTGLGKTYIFLLLAAQRFKQYPNSKILLLGPTRPLINQYYELFLKHFDIEKEKMVVFTGLVSPEKRERLWKDAKIIFSTPQGLENDIISNKINLEEVSLLGFDEAHRASGDYPYGWIAQQYFKKSKTPRILALTASPGSDIEKISEVCKVLHIDEIEIRTENDPDVKQYIQKVDIKWIYVELPKHFKEVQKHLKDCFNYKLSNLKEINREIKKEISTKRDLLELQSNILSEISHGNKDYEIMKSLSLIAELIKVEHCLELLESQGISPLLEFMEGLVSKAQTTKVMAVKNLVIDLNFKTALIITRKLKDMNIEHPKYEELKRILPLYAKHQNKKVIIFSQYRDSISSLASVVNKIQGVNAKIFVGQQKKKDTGLSQKEQIQLISQFKNNDFNVMIMSSVGEEGLDIPSVDCVIFYEPVPSAIRTIQRRGRTGRQEEGEVIVLVAKGTRDEAYRWASYHKEKRMHDILLQLKKRFNPIKIEKKLSEFIMPEEGIEIYADYREKSSGIIKKMVDLGIKINLKALDIGDYLLSSRLCVEHKTISDFIDSLIDKRFFTQLKDMKKYERQLILLEGEEDLYAQRKLHPNAIRGMLSTICVDYGIPILTVKNTEEAALLLAMIAKREQSSENREFTFHSSKPLTLKQQQEYIISALPGVGSVLSKPLLKKFGSVKKVITAKEAELKEVELIGEKKASNIREVLDSEYKE